MSGDKSKSTRRNVLQRAGVGAVSIGAIGGVSTAKSTDDITPADHRDIEIDYLAADPSLLASGENTDLLMAASGDDWEQSTLRVERCGPDDWQCEDTELIDTWDSDAVYDVSFQQPGFYELTGAAMDENGSGIPEYRHFWVDDGSYGTLPEPTVSGPTSVSTGEEVSFDLHSTTMEYGDITGYRWYVDGDFQWGPTGPVFETSFDDPGTYTVGGAVEGVIPNDYGPYDLHNDLKSGFHMDTLEVTVSD